MVQKISFLTPDQVTIVGAWVTVPEAREAVLLAHMMPETKESWSGLQERLAARGVASLAIDLRGHGESLFQDGQTLEYLGFDDAQHQATIQDLEAAVEWLAANGWPRDQIGLVGASIGANLALQLLKEMPELRFAALLSPGDYRGIDAARTAGDIGAKQAVCIIAAEDDIGSFGKSQETYANLKTQDKVFWPQRDAGHGTRMFITVPRLMDELADWIAARPVS